MLDNTDMAKETAAENSKQTERLERHKKRKPYFSQPATFVTFLVGPGDSPEKFVVNNDFACYYSAVLYAAFNSNFVEGQTQTYRMTDTSPGTFKLFVQWIYTRKTQLIDREEAKV